MKRDVVVGGACPALVPCLGSRFLGRAPGFERRY